MRRSRWYARFRWPLLLGAAAMPFALMEGGPQLLHNQTAPVVDGIALAYEGRYSRHPEFPRLVAEAGVLRRRALAQVEDRLGLVPRNPERIIVRFADGLMPDEPVATRRTRYLNGRTVEMLTVYLEPLLLGVVDLERVLTHEMIHAAMRDRMGAPYERLPQWLREGAATWGAGQLEEKAAVLIAGKAFARQDPATLIDGLDTEPHAMDDYFEDAMFFRFLEKTGGTGAARRAIQGVVEGRPYRRAFEDAAGASWESLQADAEAFARASIQDALAASGFEMYRRASERYFAEDYEGALAELDAFTRARPDSWLAPNALFLAASARMMLERPAEAVPDLARVVESFPSYYYLIDDAQYRLSIALIRSGDLERGNAALTRFLNDFTFANAPLRSDAAGLIAGAACE
ncbi:MAG TPA: hypothetical protein VGB20_02120 [bacterium]